MINKPIYPILIHPEFALEARDVSDFLSEFGPYAGRYIPRTPDAWPKHLKEHIDNSDLFERLTPLQRKVLIEKLSSQAKHCLVPTGDDTPTIDSWDSYAENFPKTQKDARVIGRGVSPEPHDEWVKALFDLRLESRRSWAFSGTIRDYINDCYPLLVNAPVSYLIDPYLDPFSEIGEHLIKSLYQSSKKSKLSKCERIEVITWRRYELSEDSISRSEYDQEIKIKIQNTFGRSIPPGRLVLHLVEENKQSNIPKILHDRFFLTRFGGISFGRGFIVQQKSQAKACNAFILDKDHHSLLKAQFVDCVARHKDRLSLPPEVIQPHGITSFQT